ncbi:MAG: hypothetical protein H7X76_01965 [Prolixibacteraceae bacterium]|nr:hypothetical protein [Burkholderiales bacterium]
MPLRVPLRMESVAPVVLPEVVVSMLVDPVRERAGDPIVPVPLLPVVSLAEVGLPLTLPPGPGTALVLGPEGEPVLPEVCAYANPTVVASAIATVILSVFDAVFIVVLLVE